MKDKNIKSELTWQLAYSNKVENKARALSNTKSFPSHFAWTSQQSICLGKIDASYGSNAEFQTQIPQICIVACCVN